MKKLCVLFVAVIMLFCSCGKNEIPPELTLASHIRHNSGTDFYIEDYCKVKSPSGGNVKLSYSGKVNVNECGDYKIKVTADAESGGVVTKEIVVTVQQNKTDMPETEICLELQKYIVGLQESGYSNIGFIDYAEGFGNMAEAVSANGNFVYNEAAGRMLFEAYQLESRKFTAFNMVFMIDESAMWYVPQKVALSADDTSVELEFKEKINNGGVYGFYVAIDEFGDNIAKSLPDYEYLERVRKIAEYDGVVKLTATGSSGSFEMALPDAQKKDFRDMLMVYEEMLTYY